MTAEIAILNREAVALAADSASTVSGSRGQKVFSSANKVFAMSKSEPVGVMFYGNAFLMGVPWETILKTYRHKLGKTRLESLKEYGDRFINFLSNNSELFPEEQQKKHIFSTIYGYFSTIKEEFLEEIEKLFDKYDSVTEKQAIKVFTKILISHNKIWSEAESLIEDPSELIASFNKKYKKLVLQEIKNIFENISITKDQENIISEISSSLFYKMPNGLFSSDSSGIVIAGYGNSEIFPGVVGYTIEGKALGFLKYKKNVDTAITFDNPAIIMPFAQKEMVHTFMEGIAPLYSRVVNNLLFETVKNYPRTIIESIYPDIDENLKTEQIKKLETAGIKNLKEGLKRLEDFEYDQYVEPVITVASFLAKNELAAMAESLVNLTCLRKKITMDDETVGGPIDVAVISKGDGLVWIKRKHYFEQNLNRHFFTNYYNR